MASCKRCDSNIRKHNEVPDGELADAIHQKYHPNVPRAEFDQNLGLTPAAEAPVTLADVGRSAVKDVVNSVKSVATLPQRAFQAYEAARQTPSHCGLRSLRTLRENSLLQPRMYRL